MTDQRRGLWVRIKATFTAHIKLTGIKNVIGSIFRFDSLFKVVIAGGLVTGGVVVVGESANAWDIIDTEPASVQVIAVVESPAGDGGFSFVPTAQVATTILQDILAAALDDPVAPDGATRAEVEAIVDAAVARILAAYIPPGPPPKVLEDIAETTADTNCVVRRGEGCPQLPESVVE